MLKGEGPRRQSLPTRHPGPLLVGGFAARLVGLGTSRSYREANERTALAPGGAVRVFLPLITARAMPVRRIERSRVFHGISRDVSRAPPRVSPNAVTIGDAGCRRSVCRPCSKRQATGGARRVSLAVHRHTLNSAPAHTVVLWQMNGDITAHRANGSRPDASGGIVRQADGRCYAAGNFHARSYPCE
jgi:hypothetical protein